MPSISTFSFLFIGLNQSPQVTVDATKAFPLALSFTILFLIVYAYSVQKGPSIALSVSILLWLGLSIPAAAYNFKDYALEVIELGTVSLAAVLVLRKNETGPSQGGNIRPTGREILRRGLAGGAVRGTGIFEPRVGSDLGWSIRRLPRVFQPHSTLHLQDRRRGVLAHDGQTSGDCSPYNRVSVQRHRRAHVSIARGLLGTGLAILCVAPIAYLLVGLG